MLPRFYRHFSEIGLSEYRPNPALRCDGAVANLCDLGEMGLGPRTTPWPESPVLNLAEETVSKKEKKERKRKPAKADAAG
jgi:hypothetical protein